VFGASGSVFKNVVCCVSLALMKTGYGFFKSWIRGI
jgi:hypothetical protein